MSLAFLKHICFISCFQSSNIQIRNILLTQDKALDFLCLFGLWYDWSVALWWIFSVASKVRIYFFRCFQNPYLFSQLLSNSVERSFPLVLRSSHIECPWCQWFLSGCFLYKFLCFPIYINSLLYYFYIFIIFLCGVSLNLLSQISASA